MNLSLNVKFKCTCNQEFTVTFDNLGKKEKIVCPNCGETFNESITKPLQEGIEKLTKVKDYIGMSHKWDIQIL